MRIEESIIIRRPPEEVFAFFDDRTNDRRWMGNVIESEWIDPAASTDVGRRGRMVMQVFGRQGFIDEVTEYVPGRRVAHRGVAGSLVIHSGCYADPVPEGTRATIVYEPERLPGGPIGRWIEPLIGRAVRKNYRADLVRLKRLLEDGESIPVEREESSSLLWLGAAGVAAPLGFTVSAVTHSLARPDHDLLNHPVSALASGSTGWIQNLTFLVTGALVVALALGIHLARRHPGKMDASTVLVAVFGLGLVAAGVFPATDTGGQFVDDRVPHVVAGLVAFASAALAAVAMGWRRSADAMWSRLSPYFRISGVTLFLLFVAGAVVVRPTSAPLHDWLGLFQWVFLAVWFPCLIVVGNHLIRTSRGRMRDGRPAVSVASPM